VSHSLKQVFNHAYFLQPVRIFFMQLWVTP